MKNIILAASAAAFAISAPAYAAPGKGQSKQASKHAQKMGHSQHIGHTGHAQGFGAGGCPPGLAKKSPACVPPGQAKTMFGLGQRVPYGYNGLLGYNGLPQDLRSYYGSSLDPRSRYIYDNNYLYRVDPQTMLVQQVLNALIRR